MKRALLFSIVIAAIMLSASCSHTEPGRDRDEVSDTNGGHDSQPGNPACDDERPGISPDRQLEAILADPTPRYVGPAMTLQFTTPGILVGHDGAATTSFIDIDTGRRVDLIYDSEQPQLLIDGCALSATGKVIQTTAEATWIIFTAPDASTHILVIPQFY